MTAEAAGWLHDLGKYRESFQEFIRGRSPMGSKQHKEAGAAFAFEMKNPLIMFSVLAITAAFPTRMPPSLLPREQMVCRYGVRFEELHNKSVQN